MVNVMKHNYLYATLLSEFKYVADDTLLNAIKNEDMNEQKMIFHSTASVDNKLQEKKTVQNYFSCVLSYLFFILFYLYQLFLFGFVLVCGLS